LHGLARLQTGWISRPSVRAALRHPGGRVIAGGVARRWSGVRILDLGHLFSINKSLYADFAIFALR
jgi:hypothetical protein